MTISFLDKEENTAEKGVNAGHQHFLLFTQCFQKFFFFFFQGHSKLGLCGKGLSNKLNFILPRKNLTLSKITNFRLFQT